MARAWCNAVGPRGYLCTEAWAHPGDHVAKGTGDTVCETWSRDPEFEIFKAGFDAGGEWADPDAGYLGTPHIRERYLRYLEELGE